MSSGFNTDVRVGERVFHVQTEDRGPAHPRIDTAVYHSGRVVHRLSTDYHEFAASDGFSDEILRQRVHDQHRQVLDSLKTGALGAEVSALVDAAVPGSFQIGADPGNSSGIVVQLQNPGSWLSAGHVSLDVEILRKADHKPEPDVLVEAMIEGSLHEEKHAGKSDEHGRAKIKFPLPPLGKGDLALVIHAKGTAGGDSLRFTMRSRAKTPAPGHEG